MILARATLPPFRKRPAGSPAHSTTVPAVPSAPATPSAPSPADAATALYTLLSWTSARQAWADVYLSTVNPPTTIVAAGSVGTSYVPTLLPSTTYFWKIVASNAGGSATGPVWSFTTPAATKVLMLLAGVDVTSRVRWDGAGIHWALNAAPDTADLTFATTAPTEGEALKIGLGTLDDADLLFAGSIQEVGAEYVDHPDSPLWPVSLVDYTYTVNKRRPFGVWVDVSITTIALKLAADYAPTFSVAGIQAGLPTTSIVFDGQADFMTCWGRLALAMNGVGDVSVARVLKLALTDDADPPDPLDANHTPLNDPSSIQISTDLSQVRTRVYGKGHAETVPCDCALGETLLPLADAVEFGTVTPGGSAIAGTTAGGAQSDILTYAGVQAGGGGSLVGPGVAPSVKPTTTIRSTGSVNAGAHQWAYTWKTAAGESLPSPLSVALTTRTYTPPAPGSLPSSYPVPLADAHATYNFLVGTTGLTIGASYTYVVQAFTTDSTGISVVSGESLAVVCIPSINDPLKPSAIVVTFDVPGPSHPADGSLIGLVKLYRIENATGITELVDTASTSGAYFLETFVLIDYGLGAGTVAPASAVASFFSATLTGIALGPTGTTQRLVYRTAVGDTQLKLEQTIANNTATTATATIADSALGANVPTSDTSGLTQPTGQVNAGATSLLTAGAGPFPADGGWVMVGSQCIRYTNVSGNTLAGILATGAGAITTTIPYGSTVIAVPALTGVNANNGLRRALAKGSTVAIWVARNDVEAQTALGLLELDADGNPTDGIREYTIVNGSRGEASLIDECDADLAIFSRPIVSATYDTRDVKSKPGTTVAINLGGIFDAAVFDPLVFDPGYAWSTVVADFIIQRVDLSFDGPLLEPRCRVTASSTAFTLMDVLRRVEIAA